MFVGVHASALTCRLMLTLLCQVVHAHHLKYVVTSLGGISSRNYCSFIYLCIYFCPKMYHNRKISLLAYLSMFLGAKQVKGRLFALSLQPSKNLEQVF